MGSWKAIFGKMIFGHAGIAMLTLIESIVRVTIRQSDSEPIASEAAFVREAYDVGCQKHLQAPRKPRS